MPSFARQTRRGLKSERRDGLVRHGGDLVGIQNGIEPNRVVRMRLNKTGDTIDAVEVLEMNHPDFGEPTLGVVVGKELFFVANNPISQFLEGKKKTDFPAPIILKRRLSQ